MKAEKASQSKEVEPTPANSVSWPRQLVFRMPFALLGGLLLRLWMWTVFPQTSGDAFVYGNIARNILLRGQFSLSDGSGHPFPTLIRLPGYPLFLAVCFRIFGIDNYTAVIYLQIFLELAACLFLADFVRRITTPRAGLNTLWLSSLCPFISVYAAAPLSESLTFDMICLALWSLERYISQETQKSGAKSTRVSRWPSLLLFTAAISFAALLRPDGALVAIALWPALLFSRSKSIPIRKAIQSAFLCGLMAILPFAVWTARNWHTFHVFEPLAPRYANDPGEDPHLGWQHWVKTWCLDFTSTSEIYWSVPDNDIDLESLPTRAFDSPNQQARTAALIADYSQNHELTPEIDARFAALAHERGAAHPVRTHILLPLGRLADMILRPRVENLTIDLRWWEYWNHRPETRFSYAYAVVNLLFFLVGFIGFCLKPKFWPYMAAYIVLRCLLLLTVEAPETRYTLEFFPILFATGGIALQRIFAREAKVTS